MSRIFISYKRVDKEKVFKIKDQIESALGEKCWIDLDGIESDAQFKNVIIRAINACEIILFMYSKAHSKIVDFEKDWTVRELNFAAKKNKRIVFVNLDGSPLTDAFEFDYGTKQQVDGQSPQSLSRLNTDLKRWLGIKEPETPITRKSIEENIDQSKEKRINLSYLTQNKKGCVLSVSVLMVLCIAFILPTTFFSSSESQINTTPSQIIMADSSQTNEEIEAIDLSLPSGTLWANMNVGAMSEKDFGKFYSWGETNVKNNYGQAAYRPINSTKIAGTNDDVASIKLGTNWQIPSSDDFAELILNCKWTWSSKSGISGYVVTGTNGNSIFLPASGWICSSTIEHRNKFGYYWTSDKVNDTFAKGLLFSSSEQKVGNGYLYYGRCIRAVQKYAPVEK